MVCGKIRIGGIVMDQKKTNQKESYENKFCVYKTLAIAGMGKKDPETNATIPSLDDVSRAKDWVDMNEK